MGHEGREGLCEHGQYRGTKRGGGGGRKIGISLKTRQKGGGGRGGEGL